MSSWDHAGIALMFLLTYAVGYLTGWLRARDGTPPQPRPQPQADTDTVSEFDGNETIHTPAPGATRMTSARIGVEQRADGSWWLVLATLNEAGLPDGEQITPQQAMRIARLLRQVRHDGGI